MKEKDGAMKDAFTIIDHENKVCYTGRSFYDYVFERGYLLDGKGSQQEKGVMSDMREINGKQAKVRLTENGISVFYKKETLVIPDSILGRQLTDENKNELLQGKIVLVGKEKDNIFLQVDRELNAVIVRTNKELAVPNVIGRGMDYSGRELLPETWWEVPSVRPGWASWIAAFSIAIDFMEKEAFACRIFHRRLGP